MGDLDCFLANIRDALKNSVFDKNSNQYLDLSTIGNQVLKSDLLTAASPQDCLISFQTLIMSEISKSNSDKIKIGINELLKHLLAIINREHEHFLSERHLYRLKMIFKRCLMPDFPFQEEIWNYICDCLRSTGSFLMDDGYFMASREIIDSLAGMGRIAALRGLPTANTQSSLRILENKAMEKNEKLLASTAKNARFNLET